MEATLLTLGVILILVGLIGQVKAKEIEVGTKNPLVRVILGLIGFVFVSLAIGITVFPFIPAATSTPTISPTPSTATEMSTVTFVAPTNTPGETPAVEASPTIATTAPPPMPDLFISELTLDPSTPIQGSTVSVRVGVSNQGTGPAGPFTVRWWPGENYPQPGCSWQIDSLKAGDGKTLTCTYAGYPSWYGSITTKADADPETQVVESNEGNNAKGMTISVGQAQPTKGQISFDSYPDGTPITTGQILQGDEFLSQGIRLAGAPVSSYCADATAAAILTPNYGMNSNFLSTASPGNIQRCNTIPVAITFTNPVRSVTLTFGGASVTYTMNAYDSGGNLLGTTKKDAVFNGGTFEATFSSSSSNISRITFGSETAVTAIKEISYEP